MAFLKQLIVTLVVLLVGATLWLKLDPTPGRLLLASTALPDGLRTLVSEISPADDAPQIGATPAASDAGRNRAAALVNAGRVEMAITRDTLKAIGTGEAVRSVAVHPESVGLVQSVSFKSGDRVEEGSVLAVLEDESEKLALDRARIALKAAQDKVDRYQQLQSSRAITAVEVSTAINELNSAKLDVSSAQLALDKRSIRAPITGWVGIADIEPGDLVGTDTVIATIDDRRQLKIVFYVPESFIPETKIGHPVDAVAVSRPAEIYHGKISAIDSRLDQASRTLKTEALIDNPKDELRPGMSFTLTIGFAGERYLSVDPLAVQWERAGPFAWKIVDQTAVKAPVRIIERNVDRVLVAAKDLDPGDLVVTDGAQSVREGSRVRIANPVALPAPPAIAGPAPSEESAAQPADAAVPADEAADAAAEDSPERRAAAGHSAAGAKVEE